MDLRRDEEQVWMRWRVIRGRHVAAVVLCGAASVALVFGASSAWAVDMHAFDPGLSLTGGAADPGSTHPAKPFDRPCGAAVDRHGDIYVASPATEEFIEVGKEKIFGTQGRIDVFNSKGEYLTEIKDEHQPCSLAVDSVGNLYVTEAEGEHKNVVRFEPQDYPPVAGSGYELPVIVHENTGGLVCTQAWSVAVDPSNDHVYVVLECSGISEYDSAANGSTVIKSEIGKGLARNLIGVDVYGRNHDIYATGVKFNGDPTEDPRVFVFSGTTGEKKCEIDGTETLAGSFSFTFGDAGIAVDQATGDFYVDDTNVHQVVDQFAIEGEECKFVGQLPQPPAPLPKLKKPNPFADIAVDNPIEVGEVGYESPNEGEVYVTSGAKESNSHLYAFQPCGEPGPPAVSGQSFSQTTTVSTTLEGEVDPRCFNTVYQFEYTTQAEFEASGYEGATSAPAIVADAGSGNSSIAVAEPITGLQPGTPYRFRLVASSEEGTTEGEGKPGEEGNDASFSTYSTPLSSPPCPNEDLRTGPSASLPDCRAYELVTPSDTNGRTPTMAELGQGQGGFDTTLASPDGESVIFGTEGGSLPGTEASGFYDTYEAQRDPVNGWVSRFTGVSGTQSREPYFGGISPDHLYSFWEVRGHQGGLFVPGSGFEGVQYIRRAGGVIDPKCSPEPAGRFELIGCGSLGSEPYALGRWITPGAGHVIFTTNKDNLAPATQLEPNAAPSGTVAVYDRTPDGVTHVVSLKPNGSPFLANEQAAYQGASTDGTAVAFKVGETLYVRIDDAKTVEVVTGKTRFGGFSSDGDRIFYLKEPSEGEAPHGEIFACDVRSGPCAGPEATQEPTQIGSGGKSILVNISPDGSHVYFVSTVVLTGGEENEQEEKAETGQENLYFWGGSAVRFIARLEPLDVSGEPSKATIQTMVGGLGLWTTHTVSPHFGDTSGPASDPSRTTPDGSIFVFESHANLTSYDSGGQREVYRLDTTAAIGERLTCISCNPTGANTESDALLESPTGLQYTLRPPVNALSQIANVTPDGRMIFFQSGDRLVSGDTDGKIDVYEWKAPGSGGCIAKGGCLSLISSGQSAGDDFLYAMTPDGHDVIFESSDLLVPQDQDGTPSIYDARIDGGFPSPPALETCREDVCQGSQGGPPALPNPSSTSLAGPGNVKPKPPPRCGKGKRRVRHHAKARCPRKHRQGQRHGQGKGRDHAKGRTPR